MVYSVFEPDSGLYFHYCGGSDFWFRLPVQYRDPVPMPFQELTFALPNDVKPCGSGTEPKGVICSPEQIQHPQCTEDKDWLWIVASFVAGKLLFGG